jgi:hypothetical protein
VTLPPPPAVPGDAKDWTWVLERPCPECGFDTAAVDRSQVGALLRENAASWGSVLARPDARTRPDAGVWSPLEYACHVRDVLHLYDERLHLMLDQDDPLYANWDQDAAAVAGRYDAQAPEQVAAQVVTAGERVARAFDDLTPEQWDRRGRRSDGASFTVDTFARYFLHDLVHHRDDVRG